MDQCTRRLVGFGVHRGSVDAPGLCRMFNAATHGQGAPRHLSTDHDPLFEAHRWQANLRLLEIDEIKTVPHVPLSHPFVGAPDRHDTARISGPGVLLEWAGSGAETRRLPGLLQRGTEPRVLGRPHAVRRGERTPGSPCGPQQHTVGISLPGPGAVASGGLIRNSRPTGVTCPRSVTPLARSSSDAGVGQTRCRTSQIRPPPSRERRSVGVGGSTRRASIFTPGGEMRYFTQCRRGGFLPDAPDALSYPRPRAVPSRTRVRLGVSPQTTEPTRVTCATLRRVSRAR